MREGRGVDPNTDDTLVCLVQLQLRRGSRLEAPLELPDLDAVLERGDPLLDLRPLDRRRPRRATVACEVAVVVAATLPFAELRVDVPDALDKPCEGLEGRAFMYVVHLGPCTTWPLPTSLVSKTDAADEKGSRTVARVTRYLD